MLITLVLIAGLTRCFADPKFPTVRVFEELAACPPTPACLGRLDALARAASGDREFLAATSQIDADVEIVRDDGAPVRDDGLALVRTTARGAEALATEVQINPDAGRERRARLLVGAETRPIDFATWVAVLRRRSRVPARELAIDTTVRTLRANDPYLHLYTPLADAREHRLTLNLFADGDDLRLSAVAPFSNLDRAGLGLGDRVRRVENREFTARFAAEVVRTLADGATLRMNVEKIGGENVDVEIPRLEVSAQPVNAYVMTVNHRRIGVVRIDSFVDSRACALTEHHLRRLGEEKIEALIYDWRANPGGRVDQARCVLGLQLGRGKKLWRQKLLAELPAFAQARAEFPEIETLFTDHDRVAPAVPTVVLINAASASATELAAASLRERGAAWIVGARSYGKGVAQAALPLIPGFAPLAWKTIARAEHGDGFSVQGHGVRPDFEVRSEVGGARDADDELRARFSEAHGAAFVTSVPTFRRGDARAGAYRRVKRCVRTASLETDAVVGRWLRDQQLRGAVAVALCAE